MRGTGRLLCLAAAGAAWPAGALLSRVAPRRPAGTLILVRHGDTLWDDSRQFTGWADPDLSPAGEAQVSSAAASTSSLDRAIRNLPSLKYHLILHQIVYIQLSMFESCVCKNE